MRCSVVAGEMQFLVVTTWARDPLRRRFSLEVEAMGNTGFRCDVSPLLPRICIREYQRPQLLIRLKSRVHRRERRKNSHKFCRKTKSPKVEECSGSNPQQITTALSADHQMLDPAGMRSYEAHRIYPA